MSRIGLLGGTFDPVHFGHLILAETGRDILRLERVLFVPAADPPHKQGQVVATADQRVVMLELAIADNDAFQISRVDLDRPGPHYTAGMLERMLAAFGPETELWFLMGLDSVIDFPNWHEPERIRRLVRLAAATRPGYDIDWAPLEAALPGIHDQITLLPMPGVGIASHDIRQRLGQGRSIRYLVPAAVSEFIQRHELYRGG